MAAMTLIAFIQVVARYVFNYSFVWALELNGVLFAWLIFIGMSYGVRVGAHIGIDAVVRLLGPRAARAVGMVGGGAVHRLRAIVAVRRLALRAQDVRGRHRDAGHADPAVGPAHRPAARLRAAGAALRPGVRAPLARREDPAPLGDEAAEALKLRERRRRPLGEVRE